MAEPLFPTSELIKHTTARQLAGAFERFQVKFRSLAIELGQELDLLRDVFSGSDVKSYAFSLGMNSHQCRSSTVGFDAEGVDSILKEFQKAAWGALINKLEIGKLMSSKRRDEMERALHDSPRYGDTPVEFPPISEETIMSVLGGMVSSAEGFLDEAIQEEFDFWRPRVHGWNDGLKTNSKPEAVQKKVIHSYMVNRNGGSRERPWDVCYNNGKHLTALDQIMHLLDGKGPLKEYAGPLVAAIKIAGPDGRGETDYFKFKLFRNQNLHLEFKRADLLEAFNQRAGGNRLGKKPGQPTEQGEDNALQGLLASNA